MNIQEVGVGRKKKKVALFMRLALGKKADSCPKTRCPLRISGQELLKRSFRGVWRREVGYI